MFMTYSQMVLHLDPNIKRAHYVAPRGDQVFQTVCHKQYYLALPPVHCLLIELLADVEVDLSGAYGGGGLNVELFSILADLDVGFGGCRIGHLPQHGIHSYQVCNMIQNRKSKISDFNYQMCKPSCKQCLQQKWITLKDTCFNRTDSTYYYRW